MSGRYAALASGGSQCIGSPVYFFFRLNTAALTEAAQLLNLDELARVAKKYRLAVRVTGTADSSTGTSAVNDSLSVSRAGFIAAELERRGVPNGMIVKAGIGGIADYQPTEANRHTKVELFFSEADESVGIASCDAWYQQTSADQDESALLLFGTKAFPCVFIDSFMCGFSFGKIIDARSVSSSLPRHGLFYLMKQICIIMATVKTKFRASSSKMKEGTLFYQVIHNRVARQIHTGYKLYPQEWDAENKEIVFPPGTGETRGSYLASLKNARAGRYQAAEKYRFTP